jgi:nitrite reductase/ring-hydroxylating ferredoxin subunit
MPHEIARRAEVRPDAILAVAVGSLQLALYDLDGEVFATSDICPHANCVLSDSADVYGDVVECSCHGSSFAIRTGENLNPPASAPLPTYPVSVVGDAVVLHTE